MINATQNDNAGQHTNEYMTTISRRPEWAAETTVESDGSITHRWTAPTVAELQEGDRIPYNARVELLRIDDLFVFDGGVAVNTGEPAIFFSDLSITDTAQGRRLAAAIVEACDRLDGVSAIADGGDQ